MLRYAAAMLPPLQDGDVGALMLRCARYVTRSARARYARRYDDAYAIYALREARHYAAMRALMSAAVIMPPAPPCCYAADMPPARYSATSLARGYYFRCRYAAAEAPLRRFADDALPPLPQDDNMLRAMAAARYAIMLQDDARRCAMILSGVERATCL